MKNKKKLIIIISCVTLGLLALILALTSCNNESDLQEKELLHLNSMDLKLNVGIPSDIDITDHIEPGYDVGCYFISTPNIDRQKAFEKIKDYLYFYNGEPIHTAENIVANFNDNRVSLSVDYPDGTHNNINSPAVTVDAIDGVEFMAVTPFSYSRYEIIVEKKSIDSSFDINRLPVYVLTSRFRTLSEPSFDLNYNDSLQEENDIWSESYYQAGNTQYKSIKANVRILDGLCVDSYVGHTNNDLYDPNYNSNQQTNQEQPVDEVENNPVVNEEVNQIEEEQKSISETIKQGFEDFKDNVENNETFRIAAICISSVIGIALIYVVFLIIRKIWHVIKS